MVKKKHETIRIMAKAVYTHCTQSLYNLCVYLLNLYGDFIHYLMLTCHLFDFLLFAFRFALIFSACGNS